MSVCRHVITDVKLFASVLYLQGLKKRRDTSCRCCCFVLCDEFPRASCASQPSRAWEVHRVVHRRRSSSRQHLQQSTLKLVSGFSAPTFIFLPCSSSFALQCLQTQEEAVAICSSPPTCARRRAPPQGVMKCLSTQCSAPALSARLLGPVPARCRLGQGAAPAASCFHCALVS